MYLGFYGLFRLIYRIPLLKICLLICLIGYQRCHSQSHQYQLQGVNFLVCIWLYSVDWYSSSASGQWLSRAPVGTSAQSSCAEHDLFLSLHVTKQIKKLLNPYLSSVTIQMKALDEYFLMVVFTLLLNRLHVFENVMFHLNRETRQWKGVSRKLRPQKLHRCVFKTILVRGGENTSKSKTITQPVI